MTVGFLLSVSIVQDLSTVCFVFYKILMTVGFVPLRDFHYEISIMVSFVPLQDFNKWPFFSIRRFQCHLVLFPNETSMRVKFETIQTVGFVLWQDFNYGRFSVSVLFYYEISTTVCFVRLRDLNNGRFCFFVLLRDFKDSQFWFVMRFEWWSVLFF